MCLLQIFGLGFTSVFDQVLGGLPAEQAKKLFAAYLNALDENPDTFRSDAEQMQKWAVEKKGGCLAICVRLLHGYG